VFVPGVRAVKRVVEEVSGQLGIFFEVWTRLFQLPTPRNGSKKLKVELLPGRRPRV
jgi:hypothetical protein